MLENMINKVIRYPSSIMMRFRVLWFRLLGARIGKKCWVKNISIPRNPWDIGIEDRVALDSHTVLLTSGERKEDRRITIGRGTYINRFTMIDASEKIEIGENCMIGPYCYITDHDHFFRKKDKIKDQKLIGSPVVIGNDVWIGAHVNILKGVKIGEGTIIGAGSVVAKDVPAYTKVAGVPAQQIGIRE